MSCITHANREWGGVGPHRFSVHENERTQIKGTVRKWGRGEKGEEHRAIKTTTSFLTFLPTQGSGCRAWGSQDRGPCLAAIKAYQGTVIEHVLGVFV